MGITTLRKIPEICIEITQVNLMAAIANSTLKAGMWYLITDYQTVTPIGSSSPMEIFTGEIEQIYIKALSVNTVQKEGVSKTYPDELIEFDPEIVQYFGSINAEYENTDTEYNYGDFDVNAYAAAIMTLDTEMLDDPSTVSNFFVYYEDYDEGIDFEIGEGEYNKTWSYDTANNRISFLGSTEHNAEYEEGSSIGSETLTVLSPTTMSITNLTEWSHTCIKDFEIEDWTNAENYGTAWTLSAGVITLLIHPNIDLEANGYIYIVWLKCTLALRTDTDFLNNEGYMEISWDYALPEQANGVIKARHNIPKNLYFQADYRGQKVRRYKTSEPAWASGTYNLGDAVVHGGYVYGALKTTTATPSTGSKDWIKLFNDDYFMGRTNFYFNGVTVNYNTADYADNYMFNLSNFDNDASVINTKILSRTGVDIFFNSNITQSYNANITVNGASTIVFYVFESTLSIDRTIVNYTYYTTADKIGSSFLGTVSSCEITEMVNSAIYGMIRCTMGYASSVVMRKTGDKNNFQYITTSLFADACNDNEILYAYSNKFYGNFNGNYATKMYNFVANSGYEYNRTYRSAYNNTFTHSIFRNTWYNTFTYNTLWYTADNTFHNSCTRNELPLGFNFNGNTCFGSFSSNTFTNTGYSRISNNVFMSQVLQNEGDGIISIEKNMVLGTFGYGRFGTGGKTTISENILGAFGGNALTYINNFSTLGITSIKYNNFAGATIQKNTFAQGTIEYCIANGDFTDNVIGSTVNLTLNKNTFNPGFVDNTINESLDGNIFPANFESKSITSTNSFDNLNLQAGLGGMSKILTANGDISDTDNVIYLDTDSNSVDGDLISATGSGRFYRVISLSSSNTATVTPDGTDTINGITGAHTITGETSILLHDYTSGKWRII